MIEHPDDIEHMVSPEPDEGVRFYTTTVITYPLDTEYIVSPVLDEDIANQRFVMMTGNDTLSYRGLYSRKVRELKIIIAELPVYNGQIFNESCMVCWDKIDMLILSCGHVLCHPCLINCYENNYPCGLCKTPITSDGIFNKPILTDVIRE